jgi:DeoR family transcriptional regulator, fructose operon transcriptional repressor
MSDGALFAEERKIRIAEYVTAHKKATVAELCEEFGVSSATIRNDLRDLEREHLIARTHGGAMVRTKTGLELSSTAKEVQQREAKQLIARAAIDRIEDGDTIVLDTGTTTLELARLLAGKRAVTVVTNDLAIALVVEAETDATIVFLGGVVRRGFHCTVPIGDPEAQIVGGLAVDKAFMGTNGLSMVRGAATPDIATAQTKRLFVEMAASVIVLCDHSKLGRESFAQFAPLDKIDTLITDACRDDDAARLEERGVEVVIAGTAPPDRA